MEKDKEESSDIYKKYDFSTRIPMKSLPIEKHRQEILDTIRENTVVVLRGPTGKNQSELNW